jgi:hypothetical protein
VCKQVTVCPGHIWTTLYYTQRWILLNSSDWNALIMVH